MVATLPRWPAHRTCRDGSAQPGVSAQIRRLERELGQELLDRSGREVRSTVVGEAVIEHARAALAAIADVPRLLAEFHERHRHSSVTPATGSCRPPADGIGSVQPTQMY